MVNDGYGMMLDRTHRWLCYLLALAAAMQMFCVFPADRVIAEVNRTNDRYGIREEIRFIPMNTPAED